MNKKWVGIGLAVLILVWGGNLYYYHEHLLKKPLFFKHYYDLSYTPGQNVYFKLHYATNRNVRNQPNSVKIPGLGRGEFYVEVHKTNSYRYYQIWEMIVRIDRETLKQAVSHEPFLVDKVTAVFNSGKKMTFDIGNIQLNPVAHRPEKLKWNSSHSSNQHTGNGTYTVKEPLDIAKIDHSFPELLSDSFDFQLNGRAPGKVLPLSLSKGDHLSIEYKLSPPEKAYYIGQIYLNTEDGKIPVSQFRYHPYLSAKDIHELARERSEME